MNGEIICIGIELLLGDVLNSNSQYISQELSNIGVNVYYHSVVGDNAERLGQVISNALERSDIIIATGGLGPTQDDLTKETISQILELPLELHYPTLEQIQSFFNASHRKMTDNNIKQAYIPLGSIVIPNKNGTAPGIIIEKNNKILILLPGPPREMVPMFEDFVIPYIVKKEDTRFFSRYYRIIGVGESTLEEGLIDLIDGQKNPTLATYAGNNEVLLRLTANAKDEESANEILEEYEDIIYKRYGDFIYGGKKDTLEGVVAQLLIDNNITLSVAESCTGGLISSRLTTIPNISNVFHSGIVCYTLDAKEKIIGVSSEVLDIYSDVSPETTRELCIKLNCKTKTDITMAITGIAGPGGATKDKPVGLIYIGILYGGETEIFKYYLRGNRIRIQRQASQYALEHLRKKIQSII